MQIVHVCLLSSQISKKIGHTSVFLDKSLQLGDVLLVELYLAFHVLQVSRVALKLEFTALLDSINLGRFLLKAFTHLCGLALVNFLHLAVLITNNAHVLLRESGLLSELLLEG